MNTQFHLYQLQIIDSKISVLENRLTEIARILKNDPVLITAKSNLETAARVLESSKNNLQIMESKIQEKRNKQEQSESSLYGGKIKNPKELQDLQKEVASIKTSISSLEEDQLNLMLNVEENENRYGFLEQAFQTASKANFENNILLNSESDEILKDKNRLQTERILLFNQVPDDIAVTYENLRKRKGGVAVAKVEDQTCSLCGSSLTPSECQSAKSPSVLFFCPSCGRILYAD